MEIGYALLRVVKQGKASLNFERAGTTVSQLTLANVSPGAEAMNTHGITPEILHETGVPLDEALETLKNNIEVAKSKVRVFFLGANSDAFDMRLMQYTLARHSTNAKCGGNEVWFDMLTDIGVVGTIDTIGVLPSFEIIDGLNAENGRSVGKMHQMILEQSLTGSHRAGTNVDGVINILCEKRVTKKMMKDATTIPLSLWFEHSNHSKARFDWEKRMQTESEGENSTPS